MQHTAGFQCSAKTHTRTCTHAQSLAGWAVGDNPATRLHCKMTGICPAIAKPRLSPAILLLSNCQSRHSSHNPSAQQLPANVSPHNHLLCPHNPSASQGSAHTFPIAQQLQPRFRQSPPTASALPCPIPLEEHRECFPSMSYFGGVRRACGRGTQGQP
jgi:hypothetical protein